MNGWKYSNFSFWDWFVLNVKIVMKVFCEIWTKNPKRLNLVSVKSHICIVSALLRSLIFYKEIIYAACKIHILVGDLHTSHCDRINFISQVYILSFCISFDYILLNVEWPVRQGYILIMGGAFVWAPHLLYVEGELREVTVIPDELNLFDLKDTIIGLGYSE